VHAVGAVFGKAPMATAFDLQAFDDKSVTTAPPLCNERRVGVCPPDAIARRIEDPLESEPI
jgi:hypothetical protein